MTKAKITARKYRGDDKYSWAVFKDGRPVVTGLSRTEVAYYKQAFDRGINCVCSKISLALTKQIRLL